MILQSLPEKNINSQTAYSQPLLSYEVKMQYGHFRFLTNYFLLTLGDFVKKLIDNQCSSVTKGSIYHIKCMSIQVFTMGVD